MCLAEEYRSDIENVRQLSLLHSVFVTISQTLPTILDKIKTCINIFCLHTSSIQQFELWWHLPGHTSTITSTHHYFSPR